MSVEQQAPALTPQLQNAITELQGLIRKQYPDATFQVTKSPENPETVLLKPVVDVEDRDSVMDVVIDRLVELQTVEQVPLFVVPIRPAARNAALRAASAATAPAWRKRQQVT